MTVVPTETRERDRQIRLAFVPTPLQVLVPAPLGMVFYILQRLVPAHRPRANDVSLADTPVQGRVVHAVAVERPPPGRHAQQDREPTIVLVTLEEIPQPLALGQRVLPPVVEADAPHGHDGLAAVSQIGSIL